MFIVAFPGSDKTIVVMRQSLEQLRVDAIISRHIDLIANLRIGESAVISNKYLIVRVG